MPAPKPETTRETAPETAPVFDATARAELAAALEATGLKPTTAAIQAGINPGNFGQQIKGRKGMSPETAGKLAALLPGSDFAARFAAYIPAAPAARDAGTAPHAATATGADPAVPPGYALLALDEIAPSPLNPRKSFDEDALAELAASIAARGLLQNLTVRWPYPPDAGEGRPSALRPAVIVAGERRYRALRKLAAEGTWPRPGDPLEGRVLVRLEDAGDADHLEMAIIENLQRVDVPPLEEAEGFKALRDMGWSVTAIAEAIGTGKRAVQQRLQMLAGLGEEARTAMAAGALTVEQARGLASLPPAVQARLVADAEDLPRTEKDIRAEGVRGYARLEDMAFDAEAYQAEGGHSLTLDTGTYLFDTPVAVALQEAAFERAAEAARTEGWTEIEAERRSWFYGSGGDPDMLPARGRAQIVLVDDYRTKVPVLHVLKGLPLKTAPDGDATDHDGAGADAQWKAAQEQARARREKLEAVRAEVIARLSADRTAAVRLAVFAWLTEPSVLYETFCWPDGPIVAAALPFIGEHTLPLEELDEKARAAGYLPEIARGGLDAAAMARLWRALEAMPPAQVRACLEAMVIAAVLDQQLVTDGPLDDTRGTAQVLAAAGLAPDPELFTGATPHGERPDDEGEDGATSEDEAAA